MADFDWSAVSAIFSGAAALAAFWTVHVQRQELGLQRKEMEETRKELEKHSEHLAKSADAQGALSKAQGDGNEIQKVTNVASIEIALAMTEREAPGTSRHQKVVKRLRARLSALDSSYKDPDA